ncbi:MAG TPA: XRE family transcriptional regulator [Acetobacterium sp.]|uniref:helix-turn-helix domain-containing protein n=1 Tax=Acetobacterium sp. MES1 TaxID=1899015 RepID=UPI000B9D3437|nr:helix-turn-helix domain-containing protein [Acetobacterium sp. MES1]OXS26746.1 MAG: XRE family transcriptional regulator [Acetobacterium sp. MES1]HAZ05092.1 XRE family transcriptional regulator [Acetobacterium sp.]
MDCNKVGILLKALRKEKAMTQKQVAERMHLSDKTISKWERGLGCPDVSLLGELSQLFEVNIEKILLGDLELNDMETGNLKRIKFYVCPNCGNVISTTGDAELSCCGRKLAPLVAKPADEKHRITIQDDDGEYYITFDHEMTKAHFISFVAYVSSDRSLFVRLYPEQTAALRLPKMSGGKLGKKFGSKLYYYCSKDGLWVL